MAATVWVPLTIGVLSVVGVIVTAWFKRRSDRDTKEIEARRVESEVRNADVEVLRTTMVEMRAFYQDRTDRLERRFESLKAEVRSYQRELTVRDDHIGVLEQWIWDQKPPPPPPRPRAVESDGVSTAASPSVDDAV